MRLHEEGLEGGEIVKSAKFTDVHYKKKKKSLFPVLKTQSNRAAVLEEVDIAKELG